MKNLTIGKKALVVTAAVSVAAGLATGCVFLMRRLRKTNKKALPVESAAE